MPFTDIHARLGSHSHAIGLMHRISTDLDKPQLPGRTPTLFIKMMLSSQATVLQLNCHPKDLRSFGDPVSRKASSLAPRLLQPVQPSLVSLRLQKSASAPCP